MLRIHRVLVTITLVCSLAAVSAQIPNAGFEEWVDQGGYLDPAGWLTSNDVITPTPIYTVEQGSPGAAGDHHALIITREITGTSGIIQGWISAGVSNSNSGFPYTERPAMLTGIWQYGIQPTDIGEIQIALSKWNSNTSNTDLIAYGSMQITGELSGWGSFSVPFTYVSAEFPDTAYIQFMSSADFPTAVDGSFIMIDDLAFVGNVGIDEIPAMAFAIHPSPAADHLNIHSLMPGELQILDATGRIVRRTGISGRTITLDVSGLVAGYYFYRFADRNGKAFSSGRWIKE